MTISAASSPTDRPGAGGGFLHSAAADINQLRTLIGDRYRLGVPLLKELVQNADDARARVLHLGWSRGLDHVQHPLLRRPAVFAMNDGPFSASDDRAIRFIGLTNKGEEAAKVGKFGLGLKSVFNLSEVLIYVASDVVPTGKGRIGRIINPWSDDLGDPLRPEWIRWTAEDEQAIAEACESRIEATGGAPQWFSVWLPLRDRRDMPRDDQRNPPERTIRDYYPLEGSDTLEPLFGVEPLRELARLLPFSAHLDRICVWRPGSDRPSTEFVRSSTSSRRRFSGEFAKSGCERPFRHGLSGEVIGHPNAMRTLTYFGEEILRSNEALDRLQRDRAGWPQALTSCGDGEVRDVDVKAYPHGGALLLVQDALGPGVLRITRGVFLPIGNDPWDVVPLPGTVDVTLLLHGYSFIDASRAAVVVADSAGDIRAEWNRSVLSHCTLPALLPALARAAAALPAETIATLTDALRGSEVLGPYWADACSEHAWVARLESSAQGLRWGLVPAGNPIYALPAPGVDEAGPRAVLANFDKLVDNHVVTYASWSRLAASPEVAPFPPSLQEDLLELCPQARTQGPALAYAARCLSSAGLVWNDPSVAARAIRLVRTTLRAVVTEALDSPLVAALRALVGLVPRERRLVIDLGSQAGLLPAPFASLLDVEDDRLAVVPAGLVTTEPASAVRVPIDMAGALLTALANATHVPGSTSTVSAIACRILERVDGTPEAALAGSLLDLPIFAFVCPAGGLEPRTWTQLRRAAERGVLFDGRNTSLDLLGVAWPDPQLGAVEPSLGRLLRDVRPCSPRAVRELLASAPTLSPVVEPRIALLAAIAADLPNPLPAIERRGLRHLLHGRGPEDDGLFPLFVPAGRPSVWDRFAERARRVGAGAWRWIDGGFARGISRQALDLMDVRDVEAASVTRLVMEVGPERVDLAGFSPADFDALLRECPNDDVLLRLPVHLAEDGKRIVAGDDTRWRSSFDVAETVGPRLPVQLMVLSADPMLAGRQTRLRHELKAEEAIAFACLQKEPGRYWRTIVRAVESLYTRTYSRTASVPDALKSVAWVPLRDGGWAAHPDILSIEGLDTVLQPLIPGGRAGQTIFLEALEPEAKDALLRPACRYLLQRFSLAKTLGQLGEALARVGGLELGPISAPGGGPDLACAKRYVRVFRGAEPSVAPLVPLLDAILSGPRDDLRAAIDALLAPLQGAFPPSRLGPTLDHLRRTHQAVGVGERLEIESWMARYLLVARDQGLLDALLKGGLQLPSGDGAWRLASALAHPFIQDLDSSADIDPSHLLAESLAGVIPRRIGPSSPPQHRPAEQSTTQASLPSDDQLPAWEALWHDSASKVYSYLERWEDVAPHQALGGLAAFLGGFEALTVLADLYLHPRTTGWLLSTVSSSVHAGLTALGAVGADEEIDVALEKQRVLFEVSSEAMLPVPSLLGTPFLAPVRRRFDHLLLRRSFVCGLAGIRVEQIVFRDVTPDQLPEGVDVAALLRRTAEEILTQVYRRRGTNLDAIWDQLSQRGQLGLPVAQRLILDAAPALLRYQLGCRDEHVLTPILQACEHARTQQVEAELSGITSGQFAAAAACELEQGRADLARVLGGAEHAATQALVLGSVRRKIGEFRYRPTSVPFELLQNADDAATELAEMLGSMSDPPAGRVVILQGRDRLTFLHWGRPINCHRRPGFAAGRERGHDRDLVKMLLLSASDKPADGPERTGRFGLGFKSVFLVSDCPRVLSEQLAFSVSAGMYPVELAESERAQLADLRRRHAVASREASSGTIIELPWNAEAAGVSPVEVLARFRRLLPVTIALTRRISTVDVVDHDGESCPTARDAQPVRLVPELERIELSPPFEGGGGRDAALVLRVPSGTVMMRLSAKGFAAFPEDVPTFWNVAPTDVRTPCGVVIHSDFYLDVARTQLPAGSPRNEDRARALGRCLGTALVSLHERAESDWAQLAAAMRLDPAVERYDLWASLFQLARPAADAEAHPLLRELLWGAEGAMTRLLSASQALPTELHGDHRVLTRMDSVQWRVRGGLEEPAILHEVAEWPSFRRRYPIGTIVAQSVIDVVNLPSPRGVSLADAVRGEVGDPARAGPELAEILGRLFHEGASDFDRADQVELGGVLELLSFQSEAGTWEPLDQLLSPELDRRLFGFAPPDRRLGARYGKRGRDLFKKCRQQRRRPPIENAEVLDWAHEASDERARRAVVEYLLEGDLSVMEVRRRLPDLLAACPWLRDHEDLQGVIPAQEPPLSEPSMRSGPDGLLRIAAWWRAEGAKETASYEREVYGALPLILDDAPEWDDLGDRRAWITLLALGAFSRLGRTQVAQHGGFVRFCQERNWIDVFAARHPNGAAWADLLENYFERTVDDTPYFLWVQQLVGVFQLSRWLPDYADAFLDLDRRQDPSLEAVLGQKDSPQFAGTDFNAPPARRTLGLGACFVVRELLRRRVLRSARVHSLAYVPSMRVRTICRELGADIPEPREASWGRISGAIHAFLVEHLGPEGATFGGAFDLPLALLTEKSRAGLRGELLNAAPLELETPDEPEEDA